MHDHAPYTVAGENNKNFQKYNKFLLSPYFRMTKTVKERVREFRQRLKQNTEKYETHKKKDAARKKERKKERKTHKERKV